MSQFRLIGKDVPRVEVADKVSGRATYGIDVRMPGMLYATVLRAPVNGERALQVNDAERQEGRGRANIVPLPYGVAVVAGDLSGRDERQAGAQGGVEPASKARAYSTDTVIPEYMKRVRNLEDKGTVYEAHGDARRDRQVGEKLRRVHLAQRHARHHGAAELHRARGRRASSSGRRRSRRSACSSPR